MKKILSDKYILKGKIPVAVDDLFAWGNWIEKHDRRVNQTRIGDVRVSTVFLGLDHNFGNGKPLLFETMIFGGNRDSYQERYSTWKEAEKGHREAVKLVRLDERTKLK